MKKEDDIKHRLLKIYLKLFGFASIFLITTVPFIWGNRLLWQPRNLPTEIMMASLYLAMGTVMISTAKNPTQNKAFIDFLIIANLLHGAVMLFAAKNSYQILFDAVPILLMGGVPLIIYPWELKRFLN